MSSPKWLGRMCLLSEWNWQNQDSLLALGHYLKVNCNKCGFGVFFPNAVYCDPNYTWGPFVPSGLVSCHSIKKNCQNEFCSCLAICLYIIMYHYESLVLKSDDMTQ